MVDGAGVRNPELPPRTRRIPAGFQVLGLTVGTTSAYAENTCALTAMQPARRNYLRVRGEYGTLGHHSSVEKELPPRTRRILETGCELYI